MDALDMLKTRRSVRRYSQRPVPLDVLRGIVDVARYAPSGGNRQRWQVVLVHNPEVVAQVYPTLGWLPSVGKPPEDKRPVAYVVVAQPGEPTSADCASLVSYVLLAAHAHGLGSCWFGSIERDELSRILGIPDDYGIAFVVSLGYPEEAHETYDSDERTDVTVEAGKVRVPKLGLGAILHENRFS